MRNANGNRKLATSEVVKELSKTDRLSSFINSGDKEPCWDGKLGRFKEFPIYKFYKSVEA